MKSVTSIGIECDRNDLLLLLQKNLLLSLYYYKNDSQTEVFLRWALDTKLLHFQMILNWKCMIDDNIFVKNIPMSYSMLTESHFSL